jgi:hypothetical protein
LITSTQTILACAAVAIFAQPVLSHEVSTHKRIGTMAAACLRLPGCVQDSVDSRIDVLDLDSQIRWGEVHEDDFFPPSSSTTVSGTLAQLLTANAGRFLFHFFNPFADPAKSGLWSQLRLFVPVVNIGVDLTVDASCPSPAWGLLDAPCNATMAIVGPGLTSSYATTQSNSYRWQVTQKAGLDGQPSFLGVEAFGHVVHLLEDLGSPAHTRNDAHPCAVDQYCSHYEKDNESRIVKTPLGPPLIATAGLTTAQDFFVAMAQYTAERYFSENTVGRYPGPLIKYTDNSPDYMYGDCIPATYLYGHCEDIDGHEVRKVAYKGLLYRASCKTSCDDTLATVDDVIAKEQFDELGPVIAQHVAAFIRFYAPSFKLSSIGAGQAKVVKWLNPATGDGNDLDCVDCKKLYLRGTRLTLEAKPLLNATFIEWTGACSGTNQTITIVLDEDQQCVAKFSSALVSGVYKLVSFDGQAVPTGPIDSQILGILHSEMRLNESLFDSPPDTPLLAHEHMRVLSAQMTGPVEVDNAPAYFYVVEDRSDVPVPFGHARQDQATVMLPPGLVISGRSLFTQRSGVFATLSDDGQTLSVGESVGLGRAHIGTYIRQSQTRTAALEPLNRELTFPATLQGTTQTAQQSIRIINTGADQLIVRQYPFFASSDFVIVSDTCPHAAFQGLAPGGTCELTVAFRPQLTYRTGARTASLTVQTNAGSTSGDNYSDTVFNLTGEATGAPQLTIDPPAVNFLDTPAGTASIPQTLIVRNSGDLRLALFPAELVAMDFGMDAASCLIGFLDPGQTCPITVVFTPQVFEEGFARAASLTIPSNTGSVDGYALRITTVPLRGNAAYARPIANAGPDQNNVSPNTNVIVNGDGSTDPQGLPLSYEWTIVSHPLGSRSVLLDTTKRVARFVPDVDGDYIIELVVRNGFWNSPTDSVTIHVSAAPPPIPPAGAAPQVTGIGELTISGVWTLRFFGGDDDEEFWVKVGNDPEIQWEEDETPGRVLQLDFRSGPGLVRFAEDRDGDGLRPLTVEALSDGRYLLHLRDDDPPNEIELTLVLERVRP